MASVSAQYRMADRLAKGRLAETLLGYKREGHSFDHVGRLLYASFGIEAARNTIEAWTAHAATLTEPDAKAVS